MYKELYWFALLPVALLIILLMFFTLDKLLYVVVFFTPLAVSFKDYDERLSLSLPTEPILFAILILFLIKIIFERRYDKNILKHPVTLVILFYIFWMFVTSITSEIPLVSFKQLISRLWFIVPFYFIMIFAFRKESAIKLFPWVYVVPLSIIIIYATARLYSYAFAEQPAHWVMEPFFNDHTSYGAVIAMFVPFFFGLFFFKEKNQANKFIVFIFLIILLIGLYFSYSRAAWISVLISFAVVIILKLKIKLRWILLSLAVVFVIFFYFKDSIMLSLEKNKQDSSANFVEHVESMSNISSDASNLERINRWQSAFRMFNQRPFWGWGPGTYQFVYAPFQKSKDKTIISTNAGDKGTAHSEYFGPLCESGVIGFLSVLAIIVMVSYTAIRLYKRSESAMVRFYVLSFYLGLLTYFVHGTLNNFLDTDKCAIPFWSFCAIIVALDVFHTNKQKNVEEITRPAEIHEPAE